MFPFFSMIKYFLPHITGSPAVRRAVSMWCSHCISNVLEDRGSLPLQSAALDTSFIVTAGFPHGRTMAACNNWATCCNVHLQQGNRNKGKLPPARNKGPSPQFDCVSLRSVPHPPSGDALIDELTDNQGEVDVGSHPQCALWEDTSFHCTFEDKPKPH